MRLSILFALAAVAAVVAASKDGNNNDAPSTVNSGGTTVAKETNELEKKKGTDETKQNGNALGLGLPPFQDVPNPCDYPPEGFKCFGEGKLMLNTQTNPTVQTERDSEIDMEKRLAKWIEQAPDLLFSNEVKNILNVFVDRIFNISVEESEEIVRDKKEDPKSDTTQTDPFVNKKETAQRRISGVHELTVGKLKKAVKIILHSNGNRIIGNVMKQFAPLQTEQDSVTDMETKLKEKTVADWKEQACDSRDFNKVELILYALERSIEEAVKSSVEESEEIVRDKNEDPKSDTTQTDPFVAKKETAKMRIRDAYDQGVGELGVWFENILDSGSNRIFVTVIKHMQERDQQAKAAHDLKKAVKEEKSEKLVGDQQVDLESDEETNKKPIEDKKQAKAAHDLKKAVKEEKSEKLVREKKDDSKGDATHTFPTMSLLITTALVATQF